MPLLLEAVIASACYYEVVYKLNAKHGAGFFDALRDGEVL